MNKSKLLSAMEEAVNEGHYDQASALWEEHGAALEFTAPELDRVEACLGAVSLVDFAESNRPSGSAKQAAAA